MKIDPPFELDPNVKVRTRFAPSPTGYLHVGGARTALYSWLFAKHNNGEFVLRIEDTDLERSTPEATAAIIEGMEWLNLAWEHGPYYQTKRFDRYNQVIDEMIEQGLAYRCYCSKERLEELRHTQRAKQRKNHVMTVIVYMTTIMQPMSHMLYVLKTQQKVQSCLMMQYVVVLKSATVN